MSIKKILFLENLSIQRKEIGKTCALKRLRIDRRKLSTLAGDRVKAYDHKAKVHKRGEH